MFRQTVSQRVSLGPTVPSGVLAEPRAVLVDMDDTLFDHSLTCRAAIRALRREVPFLRQRPLDALWTDYRRLLDRGPSSTGSYRRRIERARKERWRRLALSCGRRLPPPAVAELSARYRSLYQAGRRPVAGARELLRRLHARATVVVVTNNEVAEQEEKVRFLGIGPYLDGLVVSEAVGASKPDRRIFEVALSAAGAQPTRAVMLGDSWRSDVQGALGVGVRPVWFNRFGAPRPDGAAVPELRTLRPARASERIVLPRAPPGPDRRAGSTRWL